MIENVINWFAEHHVALVSIATLVIEILLRTVPTSKDWSLVNLIKRLIDIVPNKKKGDDRFK